MYISEAEPIKPKIALFQSRAVLVQQCQMVVKKIKLTGHEVNSVSKGAADLF